ncbi:MAG: hypothetical protein M1609_11690 [Firmicutes bacterium]|nr:hypothetical protein [Bacillota bacterium]
MSVVKGEAEIDRLLPDKEQTIISFCSGGDCDVGVEMAKELMNRGYATLIMR